MQFKTNELHGESIGMQEWFTRRKGRVCRFFLTETISFSSMVSRPFSSIGNFPLKNEFAYNNNNYTNTVNEKKRILPKYKNMVAGFKQNDMSNRVLNI